MTSEHEASTSCEFSACLHLGKTWKDASAAVPLGILTDFENTVLQVYPVNSMYSFRADDCKNLEHLYYGIP